LDQHCFRSLMFVNINSYGAGVQVLPPPAEALRPPAPGDGVLEVLSLRNVADGLRVFAGLGRPRYITSTQTVAFTVSGGLCMQLDGEPWLLDTGCDVFIEPHRKVRMLLAPPEARFWRGHVTPGFWTGK